MPRRRSTKPEWQRQIARERIAILFDEAKKAFPSHPARSHRYVSLARTIAMKYLVSIPPALKRRTCKGCRHYLVPGKNSRVRIDSQNKSVKITCMDCGRIMRYPYSPRQKKKRG